VRSTSLLVCFLVLVSVLALVICGTSGGGASGNSGSSIPATSTVFSNYHLTGATELVRDPSVIRQNNPYHAFSTGTGLPALPTLCSPDHIGGYRWSRVADLWKLLERHQAAADRSYDGLLSSNPTVYSLAYRSKVQYDPIEVQVWYTKTITITCSRRSIIAAMRILTRTLTASWEGVERPVQTVRSLIRTDRT
jgi:hypothetical protein